MATTEVIDLTLSDDDDDVEEVMPVLKKARRATAPASLEPKWRDKTGTSRLMAEFRSLKKDWGASKPDLYDLELIEEKLNCWRFKVKNFDEDNCPGAQQLNSDLEKLKQKRKQDFIMMEVTFPDDYPTHPFLLRIVSPRMVWYTGHVSLSQSLFFIFT